jgi:thioredoxin 1
MRLLKFYASWCAPCKELTKIIERNKDSIPENIQLVEVDIDQDMESAKALGVRGVPTMVLLDDDNKEIARKVGMLDDKQFNEFLYVKG